MAKKVKSKKTTEGFWGKLSYWKRGALIGLVSGILLQIYIYNVHGDYSSTIFNLLQFIPLLLYSIIFNSTSNTFSSVSLVFVLIWYTILGFLFGLIYQYLKKKITKNSTIYFILALIIFLIIIIVTNFLTIGLLFRNAG